MENLFTRGKDPDEMFTVVKKDLGWEEVEWGGKRWLAGARGPPENCTL